MRQEDVYLTLRSGGTMTAPQIVDALALDVTEGNIARVRVLLRKLRDKGKVRPVKVDPATNRVLWEARP